MNRWLLRILIALTTVVVVIVVAIYSSSSTRLQRRWRVPVEQVTIPTDSESIAHGEHIAELRGCRGCHGETLGGKPFINSVMLGEINASNLTRGQGGIGSRYSDADWINAIRHGVRHDSTSLLLMPTQLYFQLDNRDLGALIAWLKQLPPVDNMIAPSSVAFGGRIMNLAGKLPLFSAEQVNHSLTRAADVPPGETLPYGRYLATACAGCHGSGFSGGLAPGSAPGMLPARNLTPDSASGIGAWSIADFRTALISGKLPDGVQIDTIAMPVVQTRHLTPMETAALFAFFKSLPRRPYGNR